MTNPGTPRQPTFTSPEDTPTVGAGPARIRVLFDATHGGAFSVIELHAAPGFSGPPMPHHHTREEASFIVLEGALSIAFHGVLQVVGAGGFAHVPPGIDFTWKNASTEHHARFLCVYSPAGFEQMFVDVARAFAERAAPPTPENMREVMPALWKKYGIEMPRG